ncbi:DUF6082 family protein [Streptomyces chiangmaiensis]|uniref:DUF6082 family protein n=1 Tax=Streptomyces chiangmaiensis TaxID=766497 RepID=A0ABU7FL61_9ACTN|nr:DUF6082 family protein [Streptomyces chiangmaiensis]MED7823869.1 DUF6082 family protein [Streptomyces chiangmaiensis]
MTTQKSGSRRLGSTARVRFATLVNAVTERSPSHRRHTVLTEQHRLHFDLLCKAMDDPALAAVLDTYESDIPPEKQRQFLFANALYINALYYHQIGAWSLTELYGHLRVMCRNKIFREYWAATRHHRQSLSAASKEAELGRMMNDLVESMERLDQESDDGELEEWWVVGEPPVE